MLLVEVLSLIVIVLLDLIILNHLATSHDHLVLAAWLNSSILKHHFLAIDVLHRLDFLLVLSLLKHVVLDQFLREREMIWVLLILLLQILKQNLPVVVIELLQIDLILFIFLIAFTTIFLELLPVLLLA